MNPNPPRQPQWRNVLLVAVLAGVCWLAVIGAGTVLSTAARWVGL